ncbi:MAG: hypothetical protein RJA36_1468 [Pseudomonadota bacterium]|jgi:hypothetical protein
MLHKPALFALANPVFDPHTQIGPQFRFVPATRITAMLTVNIGME